MGFSALINSENSYFSLVFAVLMIFKDLAEDTSDFTVH